MREITEEMILDAIEDGWAREDAEKYIDTPENRELLKDLAL